MAPRALYQRLCHQLQACVPDLGVWPTRRLALVVTGLLVARHTALPRLAAQLRRVTPGAQADSIERRLRRILAHTDWDTTAIFEAFARASVRHLPRGQCVLVLDDTQQTDQCTLSTLALAYGGRALPLAWCRWSGKLEGQYWQQIDQLFAQAMRILPPQVQPVLLADRGLASPSLIKLARQRGWDYVLRVQSETTLRTAPRGARLARLDELVPRPGAPNRCRDRAPRVSLASCWPPPKPPHRFRRSARHAPRALPKRPSRLLLRSQDNPPVRCCRSPHPPLDDLAPPEVSLIRLSSRSRHDPSQVRFAYPLSCFRNLFFSGGDHGIRREAELLLQFL